MTATEILIGQRVIEPGSKVFVIAEVGINHGGKVDMAHQLIDAAADAGADAVKFQTFRANKLMIPNRERLAQQDQANESAYEMFERMELSWEAHEELKRHADERDVVFLSTPFDEESADFLDRLGVPAFKIASSDITYSPLLRHIAAKKKPILLSTGMSFLNEVGDAVLTLKSAGANEILLMHCTSCYPAAAEELNLHAIRTLHEHFGLPVGYSDHSQGIIIPLMAVAVGATLLEKHFTMDKQAIGPDHKLSMDGTDLRRLVEHLSEVEASLGDGRKRPSLGEADNRRLTRRSIVASVDIPAYESIERWMLSCKRPANGIEPKHFDTLVGMRARRNISRDKILQWEDLIPALPTATRHERTEFQHQCSPTTTTERTKTGKSDA
jgi:N,N'-diacetyllegionaminate synthase